MKKNHPKIPRRPKRKWFFFGKKHQTRLFTEIDSSSGRLFRFRSLFHRIGSKFFIFVFEIFAVRRVRNKNNFSSFLSDMPAFLRWTPVTGEIFSEEIDGWSRKMRSTVGAFSFFDGNEKLDERGHLRGKMRISWEEGSFFKKFCRIWKSFCTFGWSNDILSKNYFEIKVNCRDFRKSKNLSAIFSQQTFLHFFKLRFAALKFF